MLGGFEEPLPRVPRKEDRSARPGLPLSWRAYHLVCKGPILNQVKLELPPRLWSECKCTIVVVVHSNCFCACHVAFGIRDRLIESRHDAYTAINATQTSEPRITNHGQSLRVSPTHPKGASKAQAS
jgi:hypothetical protein